MRVLDVGCGTGDDVRAIAGLVGATGHVAGIDSSHAMLEEARVRGVPANAEFALASAKQLPFQDACFDAVRAERVFQHLDASAEAAHELRRVVADNGTALTLDQDWEALSVAGADRGITRSIVRAFADRMGNAWAAREARGVLRQAGFKTVDIAPLIATPALPVAFDLFLQSAMNVALAAGVVDAEAARQWLQSLLEADRRGEFYCAVVVVIALARP